MPACRPCTHLHPGFQLRSALLGHRRRLLAALGSRLGVGSLLSQLLPLLS
jgi:hypothetical protein